jgi:hypothetical protein
LVGIAWNNHGKIDFDHSEADDAAAAQELEHYLNEHGGTPPNCRLSMPSRSFVIRAVEDLDTGKRIAVVVYEALGTGVLRSSAIDVLFDRERVALTRLVKHLGALDGKLNPDNSGGIL